VSETSPLKSKFSFVWLIGVTFEPIRTKNFDECEFARELFEKHKVPRDEIYRHLCIVTVLNTNRAIGGHLGIYNIGSQWWCNEGSPGGSCNVACENLVDDDIADDVACADLIFSQQGFSAFGKVEEGCKRSYWNKTNVCLEELELLLDFEEEKVEGKVEGKVEEVKFEEKAEGSNIFYWIIPGILLLLVAVLVMKFRPLTSNQVSYVNHHEFVNDQPNANQ
jgi:hypothetical protein